MDTDQEPMARDDVHGTVLDQRSLLIPQDGPARLCYHGVLPLEAGHHLLMGAYRINLTFRRAV